MVGLCHRHRRRKGDNRPQINDGSTLDIDPGDCEGRPEGRSWAQGRGPCGPRRVVFSSGSTGRPLHERHLYSSRVADATPVREDRGGHGRRGGRRAGDRARPEPQRQAQHRHDRHRRPWRLQVGKHVYCEKPLTYNIWEARVIREAAAKSKVATQMGNQNHSNDNYRRVVELIQSGAIGPVREVHVWASRAWGRQPLEAAKKNESYGVLARRDRPRPGRARLGLVARPGAGTAVQQRLLPRAEMTSARSSGAAAPFGNSLCLPCWRKLRQANRKGLTELVAVSPYLIMPKTGVEPARGS